MAANRFSLISVNCGMSKMWVRTHRCGGPRAKMNEFFGASADYSSQSESETHQNSVDFFRNILPKKLFQRNFRKKLISAPNTRGVRKSE